jgi:endonuclease YncB( thermonuclease family)
MKYFLAILGLITFAEAGQCQTYQGTVTRIVDGDGFFLRSNGAEHEIRLCGIDAPELWNPGGAELPTLQAYLTTSPISQRRSVTLAAIAGVTPSVLADVCSSP